MGAEDRAAFTRKFLLGLGLLLLVYLGLTAFRDFRDNFGVELFIELGYANQPAIFSSTELPVALLVLLVLSCLVVFRERIAGLCAVFAVMLSGLVLVGLATLGLDLGWLSGQIWMIAIGLGAYLAYVPFSSFLFDRIMAATRFAGTAVFAVNVLDAAGYTGSVALQLYRDLVVGGSTRLSFFKSVSYTLSVAGSLLLAGAAIYFVIHARALESRAARAQAKSKITDV